MASNQLVEILDRLWDQVPEGACVHPVAVETTTIRGDAPRPAGDGYVASRWSSEFRQTITIEVTHGHRRITAWRKLTEAELAAVRDDDD